MSLTTEQVKDLGYTWGWQDGYGVMWEGADGRVYHPSRHLPQGLANTQGSWDFQEAYIEGFDDVGAGSFLRGTLEDEDEEEYRGAKPFRTLVDIKEEV